jgi:hypothetical protein
VLFHCLTGTLPYDHDAEAALMHAHLFAPPPTISGLGIDAPPALDEVFARGMAKSPSDRYAAASQLVDACRDALADAALERCPALVAGVAFASHGRPVDGSWARDVAAPATAAPEDAPAQAPFAPAAPAAVLEPALSPRGEATAADRRRKTPAADPPPADRACGCRSWRCRACGRRPCRGRTCGCRR